jgi:tRNA pseudouridine(55) synthase
MEGVVLLDKPAGMTSNAALQAVRRLFGRVKAGHTGTLDPLATGLLPVCLGEATKFAGGLLEADKTYEAVIRLGLATSTGDAEGEPLFRGDIAGCQEQVAGSWLPLPVKSTSCLQCSARSNIAADLCTAMRGQGKRWNARRGA